MSSCNTLYTYTYYLYSLVLGAAGIHRENKRNENQIGIIWQLSAPQLYHSFPPIVFLFSFFFWYIDYLAILKRLCYHRSDKNETHIIIIIIIILYTRNVMGVSPGSFQYRIRTPTPHITYIHVVIISGAPTTVY